MLTKTAYFSRLSVLFYLLRAQKIAPTGRLLKPSELKSSQIYLQGLSSSAPRAYRRPLFVGSGSLPGSGRQIRGAAAGLRRRGGRIAAVPARADHHHPLAGG